MAASGLDQVVSSMLQNSVFVHHMHLIHNRKQLNILYGLKLKTHPLLLVPGWTGFNIKVREGMVIVESTISYLDTLDSSALT